jgi:glucose-1-phosphatase
MPQTPQFLFFDLGKVLVDFDHELAWRQIAALTGISVGDVRKALCESGLLPALERGQLTSRELYEAFCERTHTSPDYAAMLQAASAIFELKADVLSVAIQLRAAGYRLGILSNTSAMHWQYCTTGLRSGLAELFPVAALSFQVGALKPEQEIYQAAARLAGTPPPEIFFVDDMPENVVGARQAGFDAVVFTTATDLRDALAQRGISVRRPRGLS